MKYKINGVIFDFDGVLIDSAADIINAVQHTRELFGRPVLPASQIISYVGHGAEYLIRKSFSDCNEELVIQALPLYKKYYLENALIETTLYPNVETTLQTIKRETDCKIALVTNKPENIAKRILAGLNINDYFDLVLGPESVKKMKPDPEGINKFLSSFGVLAQNAIMVGDSHTDIEAGRNAGTHTCGVTYGLGNRAELIQSEPDFYISNMAQLLDHIRTF
ncbi:MAG TPA: HAD-IA family hydrolase [Syntrophomonadaceae bacterium]|nr:HAD-IA family hydrolase [Syntrophomonadaceae bacterium]